MSIRMRGRVLVFSFCCFQVNQLTVLNMWKTMWNSAFFYGYFKMGFARHIRGSMDVQIHKVHSKWLSAPVLSKIFQ